jgi:hypothetical protein
MVVVLLRRWLVYDPSTRSNYCDNVSSCGALSFEVTLASIATVIAISHELRDSFLTVLIHSSRSVLVDFWLSYLLA